MAVKKWVPIVVGLVIFVIIVGIGLLGGFAYLVSRQVGVQTLSSSAGVEEFEKLRARFEGQQAFIELPAEDSDAEPIVRKELATHPTGLVNTVHMRIWVPDEGKLVRVDFPMWMLRLMGNGPVTLNSGHGPTGHVTLKVTPQEIERRGPGLILDHASRGGERLLVWAD